VRFRTTYESNTKIANIKDNIDISAGPCLYQHHYERHVMNAVEQASIIYPLLVRHCKDRSVVTYSEVNSTLGYKENASGHAIRAGMDLIVLYCKKNGVPQLTSLITNKKSGEPTEGYAYGEGENISEEHMKCFNHKWESTIDYKAIWNKRFELRKKFNLTYGNSQIKRKARR